MSKPVCLVTAPVATRSGYGARSRDFVRSLIDSKGEEWDIQLLSQRWGNTPMNALTPEDFRNVIVDFICPTEYTRKEFNADYTIWMDTIKVSRFKDTDKIFEEPKNPNFIVTHFDADMWAYLIKQDIQDKYGNLGPHR